MYSISSSDQNGRRTFTSAEIRAMLDPSDAEQAKSIAAIDRIEANGIRYSNQDFDVLAGALAAAREAKAKKPSVDEAAPEVEDDDQRAAPKPF